MKTILLLSLLVFAGCNPDSSSSRLASAESILDPRLAGRWESYDSGTNIDDVAVFTLNSNPYVQIESRYRGGSLITSSTNAIQPVGVSAFHADDGYMGSNRLTAFESTYSFIDDNTLELCGDDCQTFARH